MTESIRQLALPRTVYEKRGEQFLQQREASDSCIPSDCIRKRGLGMTESIKQLESLGLYTKSEESQHSYHRAKVPKCQNAKVPKCQSAKVPKCQSARAPKCQSAKVPKCQNAKVPKCQGRVTSWYSYQSSFSGREKDRQPESLGLYMKSEESYYSYYSQLIKTSARL